MKYIFRSLLFLLLAACSEKQKPIENPFDHGVSDGPKPWNSEKFDDHPDKFTFAIISDLYGGERAGVFEVAVQQLNLLQPEFILSVGDLIDGGTEDSIQLATEWDSFEERTAQLTVPFFHLGGNHDLTNPVMRQFWKQRFGPRYYHFVFEDVLFLMMDSEDYEEDRMIEIYEARAYAIKIMDGLIEGDLSKAEYMSMPERRTGCISQAQTEYFKEVLATYPEVRWTFVLMHKPVWMREDQNGLGPLEEALADRTYTVINGHFHSYSHRIRNERDYIILGTTGGSQNPTDSMAFDHITLVRMDVAPVITSLKMDGILDETGLPVR